MPLIQTPRLDLFEWQEEHAEFLHELNSDPDVIRYTGEPPFNSVEEGRAFIRNYDEYKKNGHGRWLCALRDTGELIGWSGLKKETENGETFIDLGYRFLKKHWGKGYATESAYASLKYGFDVLEKEVIVARAVKENVASIQVMKKLGMSFQKGAACHGLPAEYYTIAREEFDRRYGGNNQIYPIVFPA